MIFYGQGAFARCLCAPSALRFSAACRARVFEGALRAEKRLTSFASSIVQSNEGRGGPYVVVREVYSCFEEPDSTRSLSPSCLCTSHPQTRSKRLQCCCTTSSAAANVTHLSVSQSLKGPKDSSAAVQPLLQQPMTLICLSHNHLKVQKTPVLLYKPLLQQKMTLICLSHKQTNFGTRLKGINKQRFRWQPCSGCGVKWKDTWELHSDE
ncbi:uncharacterized protein [Misgurnus anguillicaudatus]|uniref:uncharacterized protein n=1 Tax=Misgurnus anguillicaudatus TaxID=75329 RepID=UPI003CCFAD40